MIENQKEEDTLIGDLWELVDTWLDTNFDFAARELADVLVKHRMEKKQ